MQEINKKGVIGTLAASGGNVGYDTANQAYYIATNDTSNHAGTPYTIVSAPQTLFDSIAKGSIKKITNLAPVYEQSQIVLLGWNQLSAGVQGTTQEAIVVGTEYKVLLQIHGETYEKYIKQPRRYATISPVLTSGTAEGDRIIVYTALAAKINADTNNNHVTAYVAYGVAFTTGTGSVVGTGTVTAFADTAIIATNTATIAYGTSGLQQTSGATAKVVGITITSGTIAAGTAAGYIYLTSVAGTWSSASKTLTFTDGSGNTIVVTTAAALQVGLIIKDVAGYYQPSASPSSLIPAPLYRYGASLVESPATLTDAAQTACWKTSVPVTIVPAVYSQGIGSAIAKFQPHFYYTAEEVVYGDGNFVIYGSALDTTKTYSLSIIEVGTEVSIDALSNSTNNQRVIYKVYYDNINLPGDAVHANVTAFQTAIASI